MYIRVSILHQNLPVRYLFSVSIPRAYNRDRGPTDADGSHFGARGPSFSRLLRPDVEGRGEGAPESVGAHYGSSGRRTNSSRRTRGLRDGAPRVGPRTSEHRYPGGGVRGTGIYTDVVVRLIFDIGAPRASFLTGDRTRATCIRDVSCTMTLCASGLFVCGGRAPSGNRPFAASR